MDIWFDGLILGNLALQVATTKLYKVGENEAPHLLEGSGSLPAFSISRIGSRNWWPFQGHPWQHISSTLYLTLTGQTCALLAIRAIGSIPVDLGFKNTRFSAIAYGIPKIPARHYHMSAMVDFDLDLGFGVVPISNSDRLTECSYLATQVSEALQTIQKRDEQSYHQNRSYIMKCSDQRQYLPNSSSILSVGRINKKEPFRAKGEPA